MRKKLLRVGVLTIGILTLALVNWAVASKPAENSGTAYSNPDMDAPCNNTACTSRTDMEGGPTVRATGPVMISSPTNATLQVTCHPIHPGGQTGPPGPCEGPIKIYMGGVMDSKNYVHLQPNVPTTITLTLTAAGRAETAKAWAHGPGLTKGTCPVVADKMTDNDNGPKTTVSYAPDFVVG